MALQVPAVRRSALQTGLMAKELYELVKVYVA